MPVPSTRTRPSSPSRSVWRRPDELGHHAGAARARGRAPQGRGGAGVSHAGVGEVERQRADAGRLLSPAVARVAHPAAVHGDGHAGRIRRAGVVPGRRGDGAGGGDATRDRAGVVPGGRAASQEAAGAGTVAERSGIYIIDLQKTLRQIEAAQELLRGVVLKGENVLFVCTKKQLKNILQAEAQRCGAFYVTERWLGGTLTNFQTIKKQIKRLKELEQGTAEGEFENYTKKEQLLFDRERGKLEKYLSGIKNMSRLPGALFVVDSKKERIAVAEANKLSIPVVAIVDTNADPELITVPIPGNDDAIRAVSLITAAIADVISEARHQMPLREVAEEGEAVTYSTETGVEAEAEGERKKKPARRKRRPKPEAIAARLKTEEAPAPAPAPAESSGGSDG